MLDAKDSGFKKDKLIYFIGIKGSGMAALAELLHNQGYSVSGSDVDEKFFTDELLQKNGIPYYEGFSAQQVPGDVQAVIYSAAYKSEDNPEMAAAECRGIPMFVYPEALGIFSRSSFSIGISGIHGKTTTTALTSLLAKYAGLPFSALVGSVVPAFKDHPTFHQGDKYFIAETCEYRRHFLHFFPDLLMVTSIEEDHLDYFKDIEDIYSAFTEYADRLSQGQTVVYCADDSGTVEWIKLLKVKRKDLKLIPYGFRAQGSFRVVDHKNLPGKNRFSLAGMDQSWELRVPGLHNILNASGALAVVFSLLEKEGRQIDQSLLEDLKQGLWAFTGTKRRSEILGEKEGVLYMDDYGHHPTAISSTLAGIKEFYPNRRLVVDFMSHTYSRTESLLEEFAQSFNAADHLFLHKIYASAREKEGHVNGETLYNAVQKYHSNVEYIHEPLDALARIREELRPGDLFITLGAGNNWIIAEKLLHS